MSNMVMNLHMVRRVTVQRIDFEDFSELKITAYNDDGVEIGLFNLMADCRDETLHIEQLRPQEAKDYATGVRAEALAPSAEERKS